MEKYPNIAPSSAALGTTSGSGSIHNSTPSATTAQGGSSSAGKFVAGYLLGLASAGLVYLVTKGKGKRSNASRNEDPLPSDEPTPSADFAALDHSGEGMAAEQLNEPTTLALASVAKRKLTDEEVALIRAWYDGGVPAKETAARLGISVKTVYARRKKQKSNQQNQKNDGSQE